ncbi:MULTISPECIES: antiviral reverse transcriptase Drt3a [Brevundimonas]|uniref:antiviral reverse transcriptase Drt3a n=1 Tax=Brevundimonas TaxID=41275 RepID=UPI0025C5207B|nr:MULTISPECIES: antiviral reverse transcriptase Drt3a [Brevundimonas]
MSASAFSIYAFARALRAGDSSRFKVTLKTDKDSEIQKAIACARDPQSLADYTEIRLGSKDGVAYGDYSTALVLRALASNVKYRARIRMPSREKIINGVLQSCRDATPLYIYRRDIASFYESIPLAPIRSGLEMTAVLSPMANRVLAKFLEVHCVGNTHGLPRGVSLSAVLSEYVMKEFDRDVMLIEGAYRYFRFADDIILFSYEPIEDLDQKLEAILPDGLKLSTKAHKKSNIALPDQKDQSGYKTFEYLGYDFNLSQRIDKANSAPRNVSITIANTKVKRIKTRVILSLKAYSMTRDRALLIDRIQYLTSNFSVRRTGLTVKGPKRTIKSGVYYNYKQCLNSEQDMTLPRYETQLNHLDAFLRSILFGPTSSFSSVVNTHLSAAQLTQLRSLSFLAGFQVPMMARFKADRLGVIKAVWAYV